MKDIKIVEGKLQNNDFNFAIIASRFNNFIVKFLIEGAVDFLKRHNVAKDKITIIRVPGSYEMPQLTKIVAGSRKYDGIICLGALIKGETHHFDVLANEVTKGIAQIALESLVPIGFGLLTTYTVEQAIERAGNKAGDKGADAASSCLEMVNLCSVVSCSSSNISTI